MSDTTQYNGYKYILLNIPVSISWFMVRVLFSKLFHMKIELSLNVPLRTFGSRRFIYIQLLFA